MDAIAKISARSKKDRARYMHVRSLRILSDLWLRRRDLNLAGSFALLSLDAREPHMRDPAVYLMTGQNQNTKTNSAITSRASLILELLAALEVVRELEARGKVTPEELQAAMRSVESFMTAVEKLWMLYESVTMHLIRGAYRQASDLLSGPSPLAALPRAMRQSLDNGKSEGALALQFHRSALQASTSYCELIVAFNDHLRLQEAKLRKEVLGTKGPAITASQAAAGAATPSPSSKRRAPARPSSPPPRAASSHSLMFHSRFLWRSLTSNESALQLHTDSVAALRSAATHPRGTADFAFGAVQLHFMAGAASAAVSFADQTCSLNSKDADLSALRCATLVATGLDASLLPPALSTSSPSLHKRDSLGGTQPAAGSHSAASGGGFFQFHREGGAGPGPGSGSQYRRDFRGRYSGYSSQFGFGLESDAGQESDTALPRMIAALQACIVNDPCSRTAAEAGLRISRLLSSEDALASFLSSLPPSDLVAFVESLCLLLEIPSSAALRSASAAVQLPLFSTLQRIFDFFASKLQLVVTEFEMDETMLGMEMEEARLESSLRPLLLLRSAFYLRRASIWPRVVFSEGRHGIKTILKACMGTSQRGEGMGPPDLGQGAAALSPEAELLLTKSLVEIAFSGVRSSYTENLIAAARRYKLQDAIVPVIDTWQALMVQGVRKAQTTLRKSREARVHPLLFGGDGNPEGRLGVPSVRFGDAIPSLPDAWWRVFPGSLTKWKQ